MPRKIPKDELKKKLDSHIRLKANTLRQGYEHLYGTKEKRKAWEKRVQLDKLTKKEKNLKKKGFKPVHTRLTDRYMEGVKRSVTVTKWVNKNGKIDESVQLVHDRRTKQVKKDEKTLRRKIL